MNFSKGSKSPKNSLAHLAASNSAQKSFVPPILHEVGKLAAGVASISPGTLGTSTPTGSATGNPRNKCALSPGHSLMDWIRLGSSGRDLTGVGARAGHMSVTPAELAEHASETDLWLAIRGKVYNATAYLPFHPGGPSELMKAAGTDATQLFEQVHAWVNYDSILQKCYIGRLVNIDPSTDTEALFRGTTTPTAQKQPAISNKVAPAPQETIAPLTLKPPSPTTSTATLNLSSDNKQTNSDNTNENATTNSASALVTAVKNVSQGIFSYKYSSNLEDSTTDEEDTKDYLPRFDWIQRLEFLTIIFYTTPLSNPLVELYPPNIDGTIRINLTYDGQVFDCELVPEQLVQNNTADTQIRLSYETGKVEITFKKMDSGIWQNYGVLKIKQRPISISDKKYPYVLLRKNFVNHNTCLLEWERVDSVKIVVPIGKHVKAYATINGTEQWRSYTAVPESIGTTGLKTQTTKSTENLWLLVKRYPHGNLSRALCDSNIGDTLHFSKPLGSFELSRLNRRETFLFLAAGTGITPMLQLIVFSLERRIRRSQKVRLIFFNKKEEDILLRNQLDSLHESDDRFSVQYVLSDGDQSWKGDRGRVSLDLLQQNLDDQISDTGYTPKDIFICICGPPGFTSATRDLLTQLNVTEDQLHVFAG